jgi:hypothetical protein
MYSLNSSMLSRAYKTVCCGCYRDRKIFECCFAYHPVHHKPSIKILGLILSIAALLEPIEPAHKVMKLLFMLIMSTSLSEPFTLAILQLCVYRATQSHQH